MFSLLQRYLLMTAVLSSVFRNGQFSPLSPPLRFLSFLKARRRVWRAPCSSSLAPVLSPCLHSLCSHTLVSDCSSSLAPAWPSLSPAGAAAALLCSRRDLRKGNMTTTTTTKKSQKTLHTSLMQTYKRPYKVRTKVAEQHR